MSNNKYIKAAKSAGESFSIGVAVATFVVGALAIIFPIPAVGGLIIAGIVGLIAGCVSGRNTLKQIAKEERRKRAQDQSQLEMVQLTEDVKRDVTELKQAMNKSHDPKNRKKSHHHVQYVRLKEDQKTLEDDELKNLSKHSLCSNDRLFKENKVYNCPEKVTENVSCKSVCMKK